MYTKGRCYIYMILLPQRQNLPDGHVTTKWRYLTKYTYEFLQI